MAIRDAIAAAARAFADKIGQPAFAGTPFPTGSVANPQQLTQELGGTGTFNFGGFIRGEDFNPQMDAQTAIKNYDEMRRSDSQVHAALEVVKLPIRTAEYEIDPADPDDPQSVAVAEFVEWCLFENMSTTWDDFVRQALLMLDFGFMLFEKVWSLQEDGPYAGRVVIKKLAARQPKTLWQWFTDEDGSLISIKQLAVKAGTYQFLDVPASKLVRFTFQQEGDNFAGISMLRSAYPHWLIKKQLYVIDAIRATRFGVGIPRAKLLQGYKPTADDRNALALMLQGLSSHQHAYIIQPEQVEIDILMPQGVRGGVEVLSSIEHQNEQITRNILAQFLDMGGQANGGSRALGASAMEFFLNAIESIAHQLCDVINKQLIKDLVDLNFDVKDYPKLRPVGINEPDGSALATAAAALTAAGLMTPGDRKTENTFRKILNIPELADDQMVPGMPGVQDPNAPPTSPQGAPPAPQQPGPMPGNSNVPPEQLAPPHLADTTTAGAHPAATVVMDATPAVTTVTEPAKAVLPPNPQRAEFEDGRYMPKLAPTMPTPGPMPVPAPTLAWQPVIIQDPGAPRQVVQPEWKTPAEGSHMRPLVPDAAPQAQPANTTHDPRQPHPAVTSVVTPTPAVSNAGPVPPTGPPNVAPQQVVAEPVPEMRYVPPTAAMARSTVPSSGDADEEGHSSIGPATFQQRVEASAQGKTLLSEGTRRKRRTASDEPWRDPTPLEARILELREIPRRLDTARAALLATLSGVREEQILRIARAVAHASPETDLKAPLVGKMAADIERVARSIYEFGQEQVRGELKKQGLGGRFAFAAPKKKSKDAPAKDDSLKHLTATAKVSAQNTADKLLASARAEALRLKRAGWDADEIEEALKIHLGELSDADVKRLANERINEAFSLGRVAESQTFKDDIDVAVYSAILDNHVCDVCEALDGKEVKVDSVEYEELMPPNENCEGGDQCRCTYIYVMKGSRSLADWDESLHPRVPAGSPEGGQFTGEGGGGSGSEPVPGHLEKFHALKAEWARVNNGLLEHVNDPNAPEAKAKMAELKQIVKDMYALKADPGGAKGIGLPGGARDVVVVGAGPGGLAAAIMGGADGLDTLVIDGNTVVGGQAKFSSRIENYPGFPIGTTGNHLATAMFEQAERIGAEAKLGVRVTGLSYDAKTGLKTLTLSNGEKVESRTVIIAGGVEFRKMDFNGSDSPSVVYADGKRLSELGAGKPVVVVGGSNGAAQAALGAAQKAAHVSVLSRSPITQGMSDYQVQALRNHPKISVIEGDEISHLIKGDDQMSKMLVTKGGREIPAKAVGIFIGGGPNTSWLPKDVERLSGRVQVDNDLQTTMPGVFAVGDMRHGSIGRIGAAVGDGQLAARNVFTYFPKMPKQDTP